MPCSAMTLAFLDFKRNYRRGFARLLALVTAWFRHGHRGFLRILLLCRFNMLSASDENQPSRPCSRLEGTVHCSTEPQVVAHTGPGPSCDSSSPQPGDEFANPCPVRSGGDSDALSNGGSSLDNYRSPLLPNLSSDHPSFFCTAPELLPRYTVRPTIAKTDGISTLAPNTRSFTRSVPVSWTLHVSPEGARYYEHTSGFLRIITDTALHEEATFNGIAVFLRQIEDFYSTNELPRDSQVEMVIDLVPEHNGQSATCGYYLADHSRRVIFWFDSFKPEDLPRCYDVYGAFSSQHIQLELEAQYWYHCALFPSALSVTSELVRELRDNVVFAIGDVMTSAEPPGSHSQPDLFNMLTLIDGLNDQLNTESVLGPGAAFVISRFMWRFASYKFYQFYGEPCARLKRDASVFGNVAAARTRSTLFKVTAPLMFNASWIHVQVLESIYVDELLNEVHWLQFIEKLYAEWQELTLYATVLLNADIAFLSIPTVQDGMANRTSIGQIAGYISVVTSLSSIIVNLALMRQHRMHRDNKTVLAAAAFLGHHFHATFGLESLAQLYSLPFVLLMWGTIAFLIAFLGMCFQSSDNLARSFIAFSTFSAVVVVMRYYYFDSVSFKNALKAFNQTLQISDWWHRETVRPATV